MLSIDEFKSQVQRLKDKWTIYYEDKSKLNEIWAYVKRLDHDSFKSLVDKWLESDEAIHPSDVKYQVDQILYKVEPPEITITRKEFCCDWGRVSGIDDEGHRFAFRCTCSLGNQWKGYPLWANQMKRSM